MMTDEIFLYLTTTGHKTGKPHRIEIWYVDINGHYYIVSEKGETSHWVQNVRINPNVTFSIGTSDLPENTRNTTKGIATLISPGSQPEIAQKVRQAMDTKYNWSDGLIVQLEATE